MSYIMGRDRLQASVECFEDYVETDNEVRVTDKIIDTLDIESLGFKIGNTDISGRPMF